MNSRVKGPGGRFAGISLLLEFSHTKVAGISGSSSRSVSFTCRSKVRFNDLQRHEQE
jgi:hypothetical protein